MSGESDAGVAIDVGARAGAQDGLLDEETARPQSLRAFANTVCLMAGVGILALPSKTAAGGWIVLPLIGALVGMACYCARLLTDLLYIDQKDGGERLGGFAEIGSRVGGWWGAGFAHFATKAMLLSSGPVLANLGAILIKDAYLQIRFAADLRASAATTAYDAADTSSLLNHMTVIFCVAQIIPTVLLPSMKEVSVLSLFGALMTAGTVVAVLCVGPIAVGGDAGGGHTFVNGAHLGDGYGGIVLSLAGVSGMPAVEASMGAGRAGAAPYKRVLLFVFAALGVMYLLTAFTGYYLYGDGVKGLILESLPTDGNYLYVQVALNIGMGLHCYIVSGIVNHALAEEFERRLIGPLPNGAGDASEDGAVPTKAVLVPTGWGAMTHVKGLSGVYRTGVRVALITWSFAIAYCVPNFGTLCDLAGCFCVFSIYTLPCVFSIAARGPRELGVLRTAWISFIVVATLVGFVFGFKNACKEVRDAFQ